MTSKGFNIVVIYLLNIIKDFFDKFIYLYYKRFTAELLFLFSNSKNNMNTN